LQDGNALLSDRTWQKLPGSADILIYPFIRKTDTVSSNSYIIAADNTVIFIDPGGLSDQIEHL
jgi:hypothetical protein